jgi:preprotein translocase SecE subunit
MGILAQDKNSNDASEPQERPEEGARRPLKPARRPPNVSVPGGTNLPTPVPRDTAVQIGAPGGFFHIRKKGQGYWTRMGTVAGAALVGALSIQFIYSERQTFRLGDGGAELLCGLFALGYGLLAYYLMNRPQSVDFLIATDSEMKKVNWTSRKELMGSTKVVILFMFIIAIFLFVMDLFFGYLFYLVGVLKSPPI